MDASQGINQEVTAEANKYGPDIYIPNWEEQGQRAQRISQFLFGLVTNEELQQRLQADNRALTVYRGNFRSGWSNNVEDVVQILPGNQIRFGTWDERGLLNPGVLSLQKPEDPNSYPDEPRTEDGRILLEEADKPEGRMVTPEDAMDSVEERFRWGSAWSASAEIGAKTANREHKRPLTEMVRTGPFLLSVKPAEEVVQQIDQVVQKHLRGQP